MVSPPDPAAGRVVLLNGPPSSGKSSLAQALQAALSGPWFHRSLDDFCAGYRDEFWRFDDGTLFHRVLVAYLGALRQLALAGSDLLAEAVITPARRSLYAHHLGGLPVILIGVHCSHDEAVRRERQRADRRIGPVELPLAEFFAVHEGLHYDLEVDTESAAPGQLAQGLAQRVESIEPGRLSGLG